MASFASVGGTQLVVLGQGWLIFELSGSPLDLGLLGAAASIPSILLALLGGAIADRFNKRSILLLTSACTVLLLGVLTLLDYLNVVKVWHVLTIATLISLVTGIEWPTRAAFFPHLIQRDGLMSAVALNSFIWQSTRMMMPALGGLIIAGVDTWAIFALGSLGFTAMYLVILSMQVHLPGERHISTLAQAKEGIDFIMHNELFKWLMLLSFVCMFFGNSYMQLMPVFIDLLGSDELGYGYLLSATGIGSILGTFSIVGAQHSRRLGYILLGGAIGMTICLYGFSLATRTGSYPAALFFALAAACSNSIMMITSMTILQLRVPDRLRDRVIGIHSISFNLMPLGGLLLGVLAAIVAPTTAVMMGASICMLFCIFIFFQKPLIKRINGSELNDP